MCRGLSNRLSNGERERQAQATEELTKSFLSHMWSREEAGACRDVSGGKEGCACDTSVQGSDSFSHAEELLTPLSW